MRIKGKIVFGLIYLTGLFYLVLPSPIPPELSQSWRSTEEGDTWQNPEQKGYYSNLTRIEVVGEMEKKFSLKLLGSPIFGFRLNYPPEEAGNLVRDQLKSSYLEEIVHPLRESLFVNGWEPENDPKMKALPPAKRSDLIANGKVYQAKITIKPVYSAVWSGVLVWSLIFPATALVFKSLKHSLNVSV